MHHHPAGVVIPPSPHQTVPTRNSRPVRERVPHHDRQRVGEDQDHPLRDPRIMKPDELGLESLVLRQILGGDNTRFDEIPRLHGERCPDDNFREDKEW